MPTCRVSGCEAVDAVVRITCEGTSPIFTAREIGYMIEARLLWGRLLWGIIWVSKVM